MSELGEKVREGEERREKGEKERDAIIITLQEKVHTYKQHTTLLCLSQHTISIVCLSLCLSVQITSLENELQIQSKALEVSGDIISGAHTQVILGF